MKAVAVFLLVLSCLALSDAWRCTQAPRLTYAKQIDAGQGVVVATNRYNRAYMLNRNGWYLLGRSYMRYVTVGTAGIWGIGSNNRLYKYFAGNFIQASSATMRQVDAGGNGQLVGVASNSYAYCMRDYYTSVYYGRSTRPLQAVRSRMRHISCGRRNGCWGVDTRYRVYMTRSISQTNCRSSSWSYVAGLSMRMVEVGADGSVFGLATNGRVYQRYGITYRRPYGTRWVPISLCNSPIHISYDLGRLWVVARNYVVSYCTR